MKTEDALKHFKWKFTQSNSKATKTDKEALNAIIIALNNQEKTVLNNNVNLCKLLIHTFKKECLQSAMLNQYKCIDYRIIYDRLRDVFKLDAREHIKSLRQELQGVEMQCLIDDNNLTKKTMSKLITEEEVDSNIRKLCGEFIRNN